MNLTQVLQSVDLFDGLAADEIEKVARICSEERFSKGQIIPKEGEQGNELNIITEGFVEVLLGEKPSSAARVVDSLGSG
jgi:CRP-like cAMP-binding protein